MKDLGEVVRVRRPARLIAVGVAVMVLLASAGGVAWAVSASRAKGFQLAATYKVVLPAGGGEQRVTWDVGRATLISTADSSIDPNTGGIHFGVANLTMTNDGPDPIGVTTTDGIFTAVWVQPDDGWLIGDAGEVANTGDPGFDPNGLNRDGGMHQFALLDEGGVTATGLFAWSFHYDAADHTGHYVFTLQMRA